MPRVSVLLTCYNHIRFLPEALESILSQTIQDIEVIAIDDGSTDGTREWLTERKAPIKLIFNEKNLGTYGSLNRALSESKGDFIAVLNDDDVWMPTKLEQQLALLDKHPKVGLVHTDGGFIDGDGNPMEGTPLGFEFPRFETGDVLLDLVYQNKIIASAALARRECFADGGFNEAYFGSGDWEMWLRIAQKWEIGFVAEKLTYYRVHGANASHKLDRIWKDDEMLRKWLAPQLANLGNRFPEDRIKKAQAHNMAALGTVLTLNGHAGEGRRAYADSLKFQPVRFKSALRYLATFLPQPVFRKLL